ncbi:FmdB family zinc ribbon protein [beta proteobacterium MWH-UniP1]
MPIYAYRCEGCGFQKDALQKLSDPPLVDCPECGQPKLVKQVTAAGFALKGSGWYVTDFRDQGKKTSAAADTAGSTTATSTSASASGPAPAAPSASSSATPPSTT